MSQANQWFRDISALKDHYLIHGYARTHHIPHVPPQIVKECITYLSIYRLSVDTKDLEFITYERAVVSEPVHIVQHGITFLAELQVCQTKKGKKGLVFAIKHTNPSKSKYGESLRRITFRYDLYVKDVKSHKKIMHWYEVETVSDSIHNPANIICEDSLLLLSDLMNNFETLYFFLNIEVLLLTQYGDAPSIFDAPYFGFNLLNANIHFEWTIDRKTLNKMNKCRKGQVFVSPKFGNQHFCLILGPNETMVRMTGTTTPRHMTLAIKLFKMPFECDSMDLHITLAAIKNNRKSSVMTRKALHVFSYQCNIGTHYFGGWNYPKALTLAVSVRVVRLSAIDTTQNRSWREHGVNVTNNHTSKNKACLIL
eukprot:201017_1